MTDDPLILWLDHGSAPGNPLLGGKFASLAEMTAAGFSVPPGFGVTTAAYRAFMEHADLRPEAERLRNAARDMAVVDIGKDRARLVEAIGASPMPEALETAIRHGYRLLEERTGRAGVPVAVRSSGEAEDLADASFAGQYDTYLWIVGADAVLRQVRACWASMFGDTALTYRAGGDDAAAAGGGICVGIQQMVEARAAGVMFTLDPLNGDRSKIVMEACWGLGEGVVKGDVTPSRFTIDKVTLEIVKRDVVPQSEEYRFDPASGAVRLMPIAPERKGIRLHRGRRGAGARETRETDRGTARCGAGYRMGDRRRRRRAHPPGPARNGVEPTRERGPRLREQDRRRTRARTALGRPGGRCRPRTPKPVKSADFAYHRPSDIADAVRYLQDYDGGARVLAGGQSLVPMMNMRLWRPEALIDINGLTGLAELTVEGDETRIGALVRYTTLEFSPVVAERLPLLRAMVAFVGDRQVRNRGTIGGSLVQGDPTGEMPLGCLVLDASVSVLGPSGPRSIAMADLYEGAYAATLAPDELLTEIRFPRHPSHFAFREFCRRHNDFCVLSVAATGRVSDGGRWSGLRIGLGGVNDTPVLADASMALLEGSRLDDADIAAAGEAARGAIDPPDDIRGSAEYRAHLVLLYVARVLRDLRTSALG